MTPSNGPAGMNDDKKKAITFNTNNATGANQARDRNRHASTAGPTYTSSSRMNTLDTNPDTQKAFIKSHNTKEAPDVDHLNFRRTLLTGVRSSGFLPVSSQPAKTHNKQPQRVTVE